MVALIKKIKIWKVYIIGIAWKRLLYKSIPLFKKDISKLFNVII